jgi:hypothetical protein
MTSTVFERRGRPPRLSPRRGPATWCDLGRAGPASRANEAPTTTRSSADRHACTSAAWTLPAADLRITDQLPPITQPNGPHHNLKLEVIGIPVSDVDTAKTFYTEQVGFNLDHEMRPADGMRVVQMTPPSSSCSVVIGERLPLGQPGSMKVLNWSSRTSTQGAMPWLPVASRSATSSSSTRRRSRFALRVLQRP